MNRLRLQRELQPRLLAGYEQAKGDLAAREAALAELRECSTVLLAALAHLLADDDTTAEIIDTDIKAVAQARRETPFERVEAVLAEHRRRLVEGTRAC